MTKEERLAEIARAGRNEEHVCEEREHFLERCVPRFAEARLRRLYLLTAKFRRPIPPIIQTAPEPIRESYKELLQRCGRGDAVQDALVTLAILKWTSHTRPRKPSPLSLSSCR